MTVSYTNMQRLTEMALTNASSGVFTRTEVNAWVGGTPDRQSAILKRAFAAGEVVRIRRGLYCLAAKYPGQKTDPPAVAQRIYGPSYVSLESALSYHEWTPEAVYTITSVCMDRSCEFDTPIGHFAFIRVPQKVLYAGVVRVEQTGMPSFAIASPLKALADYVYVHRADWDSAKPVVESLRVDEQLLASVTGEAFDELLGNYSSRRVQRFLAGLRKDVIG